MTPELLWQLGRVSGMGLTADGQEVVFSVKHYDATDNSSSRKTYKTSIYGGEAVEIENADNLVANKNISPSGQLKLAHRAVQIEKTKASDLYPSLEKANAYVYDDLMYRHWDTWSDGKYNHVFISDLEGGNEIDIMEGQSFHCPTMPFGGDEDYIWSPDGKQVLYVTKQKKGRDYAVSTNTDILSYDVESGTTTNLTEGMMGYDNSPAFSSDGKLAWLSMKRDGYESDKNDIILKKPNGQAVNLTEDWDGTVAGFRWANDRDLIYFIAPIDGTKQLFQINLDKEIKMISKGHFDIRGMIGQTGNNMIVSRTDMNHAVELYRMDLSDGGMIQITHVNDEIYNSVELSEIKKMYIPTTDGKDMLTWVILPPNFDASKKYPTLLYCQGGPQGALSQFYSFRWNFQIMAAQGYIIVAPNRRGMPGHGVEWNEQISKDYGGQNMKDYLSAIDALAKEPYVDKDRLGAVGASYGGYSVFYLAGIHEGRFKSFISHDGLFNLKSMYGTTEELFFVNFDLGGPYWDETNEAAQKSYTTFNPINLVNKWDTPIMIIQGGKDYRVPIGQGLEAFQAAQGQGIKSRLLYLPEENHWVLSAQNGLVWQSEFFRWLKETL